MNLSTYICEVMIILHLKVPECEHFCEEDGGYAIVLLEVIIMCTHLSSISCNIFSCNNSSECMDVDEGYCSTPQLSMERSSFSVLQHVSQEISDIVKVRIADLVI